MTTSQICIVIAIAVYMAIVVGIGVRYSRRNKTSDDFYLGGRKLGPFVTAMSAEASDMSSWLLMGLPGLAYLTGFADAAWTAIGLIIGTYLNWLLVAKRLRRYSEQQGAITLPDFFATRWRDESKALLILPAALIVIFFVPYTASGFAACGKLFSSLFGVDYTVAMLISALIIVAYTTLGGFLAASTTDFMQSIVMTVALVVVLIFGVHTAGGFGAVMENALALPGYLSLTATHNVATGTQSAYSALTIASTLAWGLGYFGMPHILLRFMAIRDENELKRSRRVATVWVTISLFVAILIGVIGYSVTRTGALELLSDAGSSETIIVRLATLLSQNGVFAALLAGIIMAGILASTMSTADSQLLAAASGVSRNIVEGGMGIKLTEKKSMLSARLTVLIISIVGALLALDPNSSVFQIVSFAWAGFGAAFGPAVLTALFWKRSNRQGALAGMAAGAAMVFLWKFVIAPLGGIFAIYELLPAFLVGLLVNVVVSLVTPAPSQEIVAEFERAQV